MQRESARYSFQKGEGHVQPTRHVPALSTQEAAALVLSIVSAQRRTGLSLDQIKWHGYCRDSAVVQVVTQHLHQGQVHIGEVTS